MSAHPNPAGPPLPESWAEKNTSRIVRVVVFLGVAAVLFDLVYGFVGHKHVHFAVEGIPGFYALMGFLSYLGLVLTAKQLRKVLARNPGFLEEGPPPLALRDGVPSSHEHHGHDDHDHHGEEA